MEDKQDLFDKLMQMKDSYEPNPELPEKVLQKINQRESTVAFREPAPKWFWVALACLFAATVIVYCSVYFTRPFSKINIYSAESLEMYEIDTMQNFVSQTKLDFLYFDNDEHNSVALVRKTGEKAYVLQDFEGTGQSGFEYVKFHIVLLQNAQFEFYDVFTSLNDTTELYGIDIQYTVLSRMDKNEVYAKFGYEEYSYFLQVTSNDSGTAVLERYVGQLMN